jgi:DNA-binding MarR family transcriptional regulator
VKLLDLARTLWDSGALGDPALLRSFRTWRRVQRALFYHRFASAILLAHDAGLLAALGSGPANAEELAERLGLQPRAVDALLRILHAEGLLLREGGRYALTGYARSQLTRALAPSLDLMAAQAAAFGEVREGLKSGAVPAALDIFSDGAICRSFLDAVNSYLDIASADLLRKLELGRVKDFIVGSMGVSFSARLLARHPRARVSYGCLPHLVLEIPRLRARYRVPEGAVAGTHSHSGDPSVDRWGDRSYDLVFLTKKMILAPEQKTGARFAEKAFSVLAPGGTLLLWETVHREPEPTPLGRAMEGVMDLFASPAGVVSTERSLRELLGGIGFGDIEVVPCLGGQTTFVVARRPAVQ